MAIAWFIVPYKRTSVMNMPARYCAMDDFTSQILADGGEWTETEILGDRAIVKVRANIDTLTAIAAVFKRLPKDRLDDSLSTLTNPQRNALKNEILDQGYTLSEIQNRFGNDLSQFTLGDVLRFMTTRRLKPRYDSASDTIILDGAEQSCRPLTEVDTQVQ